MLEVDKLFLLPVDAFRFGAMGVVVCGVVVVVVVVVGVVVFV